MKFLGVLGMFFMVFLIIFVAAIVVVVPMGMKKISSEAKAAIIQKAGLINPVGPIGPVLAANKPVHSNSREPKISAAGVTWSDAAAPINDDYYCDYRK